MWTKASWAQGRARLWQLTFHVWKGRTVSCGSEQYTAVGWPALQLLLGQLCVSAQVWLPSAASGKQVTNWRGADLGCNLSHSTYHSSHYTLLLTCTGLSYLISWKHRLLFSTRALFSLNIIARAARDVAYTCINETVVWCHCGPCTRWMICLVYKTSGI